MAYQTNERFTDGTIKPAQSTRIAPKTIHPRTLGPAAGAPTILGMTPFVYNTALDVWQVWSAKTSEIDTITPSGTVSGGSFKISVEGEATAAIAYTANAATIQAALEALGAVDKGDVVVTGGPLSATGPVVPVVLTWGGKYAHKAITVTVDPALLTGGGTAALVQTQVGVSTTGIRGFLFPNSVKLHATDNTLSTLMLAGDMHFDDIAVPTGETSNNLKIALREGVRQYGFDIQGLDNFR